MFTFYFLNNYICSCFWQRLYTYLYVKFFFLRNVKFYQTERKKIEGNCFIVNILKIWIYFTQNICYYNYVERTLNTKRIGASVVGAFSIIGGSQV